MFGRRMRTLPPISKQLLRPETQKGVSEKLKERKQVQSNHLDRGSKDLPELQKNEIVRIQPSKQDRSGRWKKGKVLRKAECAKLRGLRGSRGLEKLRGSWVVGRGTWVTLRGSWVNLRGSWVLFTDNFA